MARLGLKSRLVEIALLHSCLDHPAVHELREAALEAKEQMGIQQPWKLEWPPRFEKAFNKLKAALDRCKEDK